MNSEQLLFNWQLGRDLVIRKAEEKWYSFYSSNDSFESTIRQLDSVIDISSQKLQQVAAVISEPSQTEKLQQSVAEIPFPSIFGFVPWGHHVLIITKCKTIEEAIFR